MAKYDKLRELLEFMWNEHVFYDAIKKVRQSKTLPKEEKINVENLAREYIDEVVPVNYREFYNLVLSGKI